MMGQKSLCFYNAQNNILFIRKLTSLPLKEEVIINKSIELFNDPEPCIIHRTFIIKKLLMEIEDYFIHAEKSNHRIPWGQIPESIHAIWDIHSDIYEIEVIELCQVRKN